MDPNTQRAEAERWLGIAAKLLTARDFLGSRTFAIRAREADPNNVVSDQILAVVDTVLAAEKRVNSTQQPDWYAVLQLPRLVRDPDLIASHYRRLVLLLNPERNRLPFADYALQLAMDAWSVLSDPTKKWLFDSELSLFIQRSEPPTRIDPVRVDPVRVDPSTVASAAQVNTFQFFQPPPEQQPMWQQQQEVATPTAAAAAADVESGGGQRNQRQFLWQQQQPQNQHHQPQPQHQQQIHREFMPPPPMSLPSGPPQQLPPQWQMRDPTPAKGGDRNKASVNGIAAPTATRSPPPPATQTPVPIPVAIPTTTRAETAPPPAPPTTTTVFDGNASNATNNDNINNNSNAATGGAPTENNNDDDVVEEVESFWTACPYCLYIFEYQKMYQDCTLRCQNCRRCFHAVQVPNPPPIGRPGKEKDNESSFCCWGFFPLGFSMTAWKKHRSGSANWVPFSPMFASPVQNGGGNFQWFASGGNAFVGPKNVGRRSIALGPRVYIDDDDEDPEVSDPSDSDSSDQEWRNYKKEKEKKKKKKKKKKRRRGRIGGGKRGRPRKVDTLNQGDLNNVNSGGEVSVGGQDLENESDTQQVVVGLFAGAKDETSKNVANASKNAASTITRKQTRRSVKDMGRLDLNVEFNNEGEEHAPTVSAVNGEEDGIENIGFFEGLDEFLSTLPILNVGGDEKAKPS